MLKLCLVSDTTGLPEYLWVQLLSTTKVVLFAQEHCWGTGTCIIFGTTGPEHHHILVLSLNFSKISTQVPRAVPGHSPLNLLESLPRINLSILIINECHLWVLKEMYSQCKPSYIFYFLLLSQGKAYNFFRGEILFHWSLSVVWIHIAEWGVMVLELNSIARNSTYSNASLIGLIGLAEPLVSEMQR